MMIHNFVEQTVSICILTYCLASRDPKKLDDTCKIFLLPTLSLSLQLLAWRLCAEPLRPPSIKSE